MFEHFYPNFPFLAIFILYIIFYFPTQEKYWIRDDSRTQMTLKEMEECLALKVQMEDWTSLTETKDI